MFPNFKQTILTMCALTALTACSPSDPVAKSQAASTPSASTPTTATTQPSNLHSYNVRIANQPYPPFHIYGANSTFSGLETDVLNAIAKDQNIQFNHVPYVWEVIFQNMDKENAHMVSGGLTADDLDANATTPTQMYMRSPDCVVAADENMLKDWHTQTVALVAADELDESLIADYKVKKSSIQHVKSQFEALKQIATQKNLVTVSDCSVLKYYAKSTLKDQKFAIQELPIAADDTSYDLVFGVRKDQTELLNKINTGLDNIKKNGELDKIIQKWQ